MTETGQGPAPQLEGRELMAAVRQVLTENPDRHEQKVWLGNAYLTPDELIDSGELMLPLDLIRPYALRPVTAQPEEPGARWPVCGTTGCVAGWGAILSAPPGSFIRGIWIVLPGGDEQLLDSWVAGRMGISIRQATHLFSAVRSQERLVRLLDALIENPETDLHQVALGKEIKSCPRRKRKTTRSWIRPRRRSWRRSSTRGPLACQRLRRSPC